MEPPPGGRNCTEPEAPWRHVMRIRTLCLNGSSENLWLYERHENERVGCTEKQKSLLRKRNPRIFEPFPLGSVPTPNHHAQSPTPLPPIDILFMISMINRNSNFPRQRRIIDTIKVIFSFRVDTLYSRVML